MAHILDNDKMANFISRRLAVISSCEATFQDELVRHFIKKEKFMTDNILIDLSMDFAIEIVNMCESIKGKGVLTNQILRSGTSIGANIHEANYAQSKADFIAKMQIALKECHETEYWLKLFINSKIIDEGTYAKLSNAAGKIRRILIASLNTAKGNLDK